MDIDSREDTRLTEEGKDSIETMDYESSDTMHTGSLRVHLSTHTKVLINLPNNAVHSSGFLVQLLGHHDQPKASQCKGIMHD